MFGTTRNWHANGTSQFDTPWVAQDEWVNFVQDLRGVSEVPKTANIWMYFVQVGKGDR